MRQAKIKISLRICTVWSESSLSACRKFAKKCTQRRFLFRQREYTGWSESSLGAHVQNALVGGRVWRRCRVSYVTGASNWDWLTVGQGLISLSQVRVEEKYFFLIYLFCFFTSIPVSLSFLPLSSISCTIYSISFSPFSGRRHKMTHKYWRS